jgi:hypothetical protein
MGGIVTVTNSVVIIPPANSKIKRKIKKNTNISIKNANLGL